METTQLHAGNLRSYKRQIAFESFVLSIKKWRALGVHTTNALCKSESDKPDQKIRSNMELRNYYWNLSLNNCNSFFIFSKFIAAILDVALPDMMHQSIILPKLIGVEQIPDIVFFE